MVSRLRSLSNLLAVRQLLVFHDNPLVHLRVYFCPIGFIHRSCPYSRLQSLQKQVAPRAHFQRLERVELLERLELFQIGFLGTTAHASISTSISGKSIPTPLINVAGLGCARKSGSFSSKNLYISSRMSKTSSRRLRK